MIHKNNLQRIIEEFSDIDTLPRKRKHFYQEYFSNHWKYHLNHMSKWRKYEYKRKGEKKLSSTLLPHKTPKSMLQSGRENWPEVVRKLSMVERESGKKAIGKAAISRKGKWGWSKISVWVGLADWVGAKRAERNDAVEGVVDPPSIRFLSVTFMILYFSNKYLSLQTNYLQFFPSFSNNEYSVNISKLCIV